MAQCFASGISSPSLSHNLGDWLFAVIQSSSEAEMIHCYSDYMSFCVLGCIMCNSEHRLLNSMGPYGVDLS